MWFQRAALRNNAQALYALGLCYAEGCGCVQDFVNADACMLAATRPGYWTRSPHSKPSLNEYLWRTAPR
jgi:TPR repeat protein